ncbi:MAG: HlyD family efflux transporter periplasmic adaptor subunit [Chloroflexi bacterium]|nr:HlyD family efflux transporter periplasmic adaptor subunit [Chloroflexota bacterium]
MKLKRPVKTVSLIMVIITSSFLWLNCTSGSSSTRSPQSQTVVVQKGDLTTLITATGNLAFSRTQDLVFGLSGVVAEVNVEAGDNVTQGQALARLDTTDLEQAVDAAELALKSAQLDLVTAQNNESNIKNQELAIQSSQIDLVVARNAQSSINSAQIDLETATNSLTRLSYPYNYATFTLDVPAAIQAIHEARMKLNLAAEDLQPGSPSYGAALEKFKQAQDNLTQAQERLQRGIGIENFLSGVQNRVLSITDYWTLRAAQLAVTKAQATLENTMNSYQTNLDKANLALVRAQAALEQTRDSYKTGLDRANINMATAQNNLAKAKRNLEKATIIAPFTGIVTAVNISGGQQANSGQVAIAIADPTKLQADILVNEVDIPWVTEGGRATLQIDAASTISLPATITNVAPRATIQSGVVNYTVTIALQSATLTPSAQAGQASNQPRPATSLGQSRTPRANLSGVPATIQLRQGLSVTANIIKEERRGALLVSSRAITQQGGNSTVQVIKADNTIEQRIVRTGLTDGQNTEITSGLAEGEKVQLPTRTATTPTPAPGGMQFRPGGFIR